MILPSIVIAAINMYVLSFSGQNFYTNLQSVPETEIGIVFWASVKPDGTPSDILKDRLKVAYDAYDGKLIEKILVSGDNSQRHYNEPVAMKNYLVTLWVKPEDIELDYAWFDTYQTLYRAREVFHVNEAMLFSQDFHIKRALYICKRTWIQCYGVKTNLQPYMSDNRNTYREILARVKAFLEVEILKPKPRFLWDPVHILTQEKKEALKQEMWAP